MPASTVPMIVVVVSSVSPTYGASRRIPRISSTSTAPDARNTSPAASAGGSGASRTRAGYDATPAPVRRPGRRGPPARPSRASMVGRMTDLLVLVRHGESTWNAEQRLQGSRDPPLSERGREQARAAARVVAALGLPAERSVSSDLSRA